METTINAKDIIKIIEACQINGVTEFQLEGLTLKLERMWSAKSTSKKTDSKEWQSLETQPQDEAQTQVRSALDDFDEALLDPSGWEDRNKINRITEDEE